MKTVDMDMAKNITKERLITIQKKLFNNQIEMNKSMENKIIEILVENKLENRLWRPEFVKYI